MKTLNKKPWYIIVAMIVITAGVMCIVGGCEKSSKKLNWTDVILGDVLPEPPSKKGNMIINEDDELYLSLEKVSGKQYNDYTNECQEKGFTVDAESDSNSYEAYNAEGFRLKLYYYEYNSSLDINLDAPIEMENIKWPQGAAGKLVPAPKSTIGKFSYDHDNSFFVYVGNTSKEDFQNYISECSDKGFNVDYDKGGTWYFADNEFGDHISLRYEGYNTMSIDVSVHKEEETTAAQKEPDQQEITEEGTTAIEKATETGDEYVDGMRVDFKEAMDAYEAFYDEYVAFMRTYDSNDVSALTEYLNLLGKMMDMNEKFEKWDSENLNDAEFAYYLEVQTRVNQKLIEVAY